MEEITITVTIADKPYRLKINREEEAVIRKAVGEIEHKLNDYALQYAFREKQDLLAMALLHFSAMAIKLEEEQLHREQTVLLKLKKLDQILSEQLV